MLQARSVRADNKMLVWVPRRGYRDQVSAPLTEKPWPMQRSGSSGALGRTGGNVIDLVGKQQRGPNNELSQQAAKPNPFSRIESGVRFHQDQEWFLLTFRVGEIDARFHDDFIKFALPCQARSRVQNVPGKFLKLAEKSVRLILFVSAKALGILWLVLWYTSLGLDALQGG